MIRKGQALLVSGSDVRQQIQLGIICNSAQVPRWRDASLVGGRASSTRRLGMIHSIEGLARRS